jgi:hypothetical protein
VRSCAPADRNPAPPIKLKRARDRIGPAAGRFEAEECRCEICAANQISPRCHEYRVQSAKKRADADGGVPAVSRKLGFSCVISYCTRTRKQFKVRVRRVLSFSTSRETATAATEKLVKRTRSFSRRSFIRHTRSSHARTHLLSFTPLKTLTFNMDQMDVSLAGRVRSPRARFLLSRREPFPRGKKHLRIIIHINCGRVPRGIPRASRARASATSPPPSKTL